MAAAYLGSVPMKSLTDLRIARFSCEICASCLSSSAINISSGEGAGRPAGTTSTEVVTHRTSGRRIFNKNHTNSITPMVKPAAVVPQSKSRSYSISAFLNNSRDLSNCTFSS